MFESRISAGATEKLPSSENPNFSTWLYGMEGHAKKCVERYCELTNKTTEQLYKVSTPCVDYHQFKEEELRSVGELPEVCSQIVMKCLYFARIGRPDILWSVWGNICTTMPLGLFQDSDFAGDLEDSKSTSGWNIVRIWKSHICSNKLDVQETDMCVTQLNRS